MSNHSTSRALIFAVTLMMIVNSSIPFAESRDTRTSENAKSDETDETENAETENTNERVDDSELLYAVVIDAESVYFRANAVAFKKNSDGSLALYNNVPLRLSSVSINLSKEPQGGVDNINTLLELVEPFVPKDYRSKTPLVMRATTDLKMMLPAEKMDEIFNKVKSSFEKHSFNISRNSFSVINGIDEGRYSWITINYLLGRLNGKFENTASALGLSDSSLQVTFMPTSNGQNQESSTNSEMMGNLNSQSYFGMGVMMAQETILTGNNGNGSFVTSTRNSNVTSPCVNEAVKGKEFKYDRDTYYVTGAVSEKSPGIDYEKCKSVVETVVKTFEVVKPADINLKKIVAYSNFYYVARNAGIVDEEGGELTVKSFYEAAEKICATKYEDYDGSPFMCLDLTYVAVLLEKGLGFPLDTGVTVLKSIGDQEINWLLGAAYHIVELGVE